MKSRFYMTTNNDQPSGWTKKKLQSTSRSQTCTKKIVMVTVVWWSAVSLAHFLNSSKIITSGTHAQQISETDPKVQSLQPALVNRKGPILLHSNAWPHAAHKRWMNWAMKFASFAIFTWPFTNRLPPFQASWKLFAGKILPQPAGCWKCFPSVHWILKHGFLCYRNKFIFPWQKMCWL